MKYLRLILLFLVFDGWILVSQIQAGIIMVSTSESHEFNEMRVNKLYLDRERLRVEVKGKQRGGDIDEVVIFRKDKEVFWFIDNKKKTYREITKSDLEKIKEKMQEVRNRLEERLRSIPPEKRKMIEEMMKSQMPARSPEKRYKKVASGERVNQWICDKYEKYLDGIKSEEIWTVDWKQLGLSNDDFNILVEISKFSEQFSKEFSSLAFFSVSYKGEDIKKESGYSGVPIKMVSYSGGRMREKSELREILRQDFPSSLFDLPAGFNKEKMPYR